MKRTPIIRGLFRGLFALGIGTVFFIHMTFVWSQVKAEPPKEEQFKAGAEDKKDAKKPYATSKAKLEAKPAPTGASTGSRSVFSDGPKLVKTEVDAKRNRLLTNCLPCPLCLRPWFENVKS